MVADQLKTVIHVGIAITMVAVAVVCSNICIYANCTCMMNSYNKTNNNNSNYSKIIPIEPNCFFL